MTPREVTTFRVDDDLAWGLRVVKARDGLPASEQMRRALAEWLRKQRATQADIHRAFDDFETQMTAAHNRHDGHSLAELKLPNAFGEKLANRQFGRLGPDDMELLDSLAEAAERKTKAHRDFWRQAVQQSKK